MSERDEPIQPSGDESSEVSATRVRDDRRSPVNPADNPVPQSPEPEEEAVREGREKLERVKPY